MNLGCLHLMLQELNQQWANICSYIEGTTKRQKFQKVKGHANGYQETFDLETTVQLNYLWIGLLQPQGIESFITGESYFLSLLDLFQSIAQVYHHSFGMQVVCRRDQGFFLFGQLLGFMYRLSQSRTCHEDNWAAIHKFDSEGMLFLAVSDFKRNSVFRTAAAVRVVMMSVDVEKEKSNEGSGTQMLTFILVNELARNCLKFGCDGLLSHKLGKCDLVKGLAKFDFCISLEVPKERAALGWGCL